MTVNVIVLIKFMNRKHLEAGCEHMAASIQGCDTLNHQQHPKANHPVTLMNLGEGWSDVLNDQASQNVLWC